MTSTLLALFCASFLTSCAGALQESKDIEYSVSAEENYERGMQATQKENWTAATKYFAFVKARFPYSKYAALAELRMADALFGRSAYLEAMDAYKLFAKSHPTHEMVQNGTVAFRAVECQYQLIPHNWFLLPPSYEMDMTPARDAFRELAKFLQKHKDSASVEKAQKMHKECSQLLADHEWYVARYYWEQSRPEGTILRLRELLSRYPNGQHEPEALWLLGKAYARTGKHDQAHDIWNDLTARYPEYARKARQASGKASDK